ERLVAESRRVKPSSNPEQAAREQFGVTARSGWYGLTDRQQVVPLDGSAETALWDPVTLAMTQQYLRFCEARGQPGDCRRVLLNSPVLTGDARYALAMSFAMDEVVPEMMVAFKDMADPAAIQASILWTMTVYAALWLAPEPAFTKGAAAGVTAAFICYVGVDTFWTLIQGWRRMVEEADNATSFAQVRVAGERYGPVMGRNAARAFALLLTAAIGQTASSFSAKVPTLPGSAQASVAGARQLGVRVAEVGQVESVVVSADAVTIALAPNAVASVAKGLHGAAAGPVDTEGHVHHIATDKWTEATHSGGPWTPKFQDIFDRAGMSLNDPANLVRVRGHQGPHPEEYHREVLRRLNDATRRCRSLQQCRDSLVRELQLLAQQITKEGSDLNILVTKSR
ncbi:MAG TPA: AHH domain-containing protein, partial [Myxococcaceae bacterium]